MASLYETEIRIKTGAAMAGLRDLNLGLSAADTKIASLGKNFDRLDQVLEQSGKAKSRANQAISQFGGSLRSESAIGNRINQLKQLKAQVDITSPAFRQLGKEITAAEKELSRLSGGGGGGIKQAMTGMIGQFTAATLAANALQAALAAIPQAIQFIFQSTAKLQSQAIALEAMSGSAEKARSVLESLRGYAELTPFETGQLVDTTKQLTGYGYELKNAEALTKKLANTALATGGSLEVIAYNMAQIKSQNRAYGGDIRSIAMQGVPLYEQLAKQLGVSTGKVKEFVEQGKIGPREVEQALLSLNEKFADLAEKASKGLAGRMSTLRDSITTLAQDVGTMLEPTFLGFINAAIYGVDALGAGFEALKGVINSIANNKALQIIGSTVSTIGKTLIDGATGGLLQPLAGAIDKAVKARQEARKSKINQDDFKLSDKVADPQELKDSASSVLQIYDKIKDVRRKILDEERSVQREIDQKRISNAQLVGDIQTKQLELQLNRQFKGRNDVEKQIFNAVNTYLVQEERIRQNIKNQRIQLEDTIKQIRQKTADFELEISKTIAEITVSASKLFADNLSKAVKFVAEVLPASASQFAQILQSVVPSMQQLGATAGGSVPSGAIGTVGSTGRSSGPHMHVERLDKKYISEQEARSLFSMSNMTTTSHYGPRDGRNHNGVDLAAPMGTPINLASGVKFDSFDNSDPNGYGKAAIVIGKDGTKYLIGHMAEQYAQKALSSGSPATPSNLGFGESKTALASWYGPGFYGNRTANGEMFTPQTVGVAHKSLPFGTPVTFEYNGKSLTTAVNDRGPFIPGREFDLSSAAADQLGMKGAGVAELKYRIGEYAKGTGAQGAASTAVPVPAGLQVQMPEFSSTLPKVDLSNLNKKREDIINLEKSAQSLRETLSKLESAGNLEAFKTALEGFSKDNAAQNLVTAREETEKLVKVLATLPSSGKSLAEVTGLEDVNLQEERIKKSIELRLQDNKLQGEARKYLEQLLKDIPQYTATLKELNTEQEKQRKLGDLASWAEGLSDSYRTVKLTVEGLTKGYKDGSEQLQTYIKINQSAGLVSKEAGAEFMKTSKAQDDLIKKKDQFTAGQSYGEDVKGKLNSLYLKSNRYGANEFDLRDKLGRKEITPEKFKELLPQVKNIDRLEKALDDTKAMADSVGQSFGDLFKDIITGSASAGEALQNFANKIGSLLIDKAANSIADSISGSFFDMLNPLKGGGTGGAVASATKGGGFGATVGNIVGNVFGGMFADGGIAEGPSSGYPAVLHGSESIIPLRTVLGGYNTAPTAETQEALEATAASYPNELRSVLQRYSGGEGQGAIVPAVKAAAAVAATMQNSPAPVAITINGAGGDWVNASELQAAMEQAAAAGANLVVKGVQRSPGLRRSLGR